MSTSHRTLSLDECVHRYYELTADLVALVEHIKKHHRQDAHRIAEAAMASLSFAVGTTYEENVQIRKFYSDIHNPIQAFSSAGVNYD